MKQCLIILSLCAWGGNFLLAQEQQQSANDVWAPFRPLLGTWMGERTGIGGDATQIVRWKFVLGDQFLHCSTQTISGDDPHEDIGLISYDKTRQKFVYRSFFSEGYVNQYVGEISDDGKTIEFESEFVENGPPGLRAKEVLQLDGDVVKQECFLANGDQPFKSCIVVTLKKQTAPNTGD